MKRKENPKSNGSGDSCQGSQLRDTSFAIKPFLFSRSLLTDLQLIVKRNSSTCKTTLLATNHRSEVAEEPNAVEAAPSRHRRCDSAEPVTPSRVLFAVVPSTHAEKEERNRGEWRRACCELAAEGSRRRHRRPHHDLSPSLEPAAFVAVHPCRRRRRWSALEPPLSRSRERGVLVTVVHPVIAAASNPAVDAAATATTTLELLRCC
ncbi:hypothetical protein Ahy_B02g058581 isoform F [Arachis hypogaea]|uniref:Uncharacterized protein n=1 Tax=Arachis hypogaea TaxID=3818 RepID=A0A445AEX4_ARAHY|nr:hypothetical protein Ahy_B02g058581 isoform F [Arachis hypogaea]